MTWHFQVPASLKITSYRCGARPASDPTPATPRRSTGWRASPNQYVGAYVVGGENCPGYTAAAASATRASRFGAANLVGEGPLADVRDLFLNAGCGGETGTRVRRRELRTVAWFRMYRAAITLQDDSDPVFSSPPAGSLLGGGALAGAHGVSFAATDVGGGLHEAVIEVDGQRAAATNLGCAPPYTAVVPCKLAASGTVTLDTAALADGAHSVRVLVTDVERQRRRLRAVLDHDLERAHELRGRGRPEPDHDRSAAAAARSPTAAGCSCAGSSPGAARGRRCAC